MIRIKERHYRVPKVVVESVSKMWKNQWTVTDYRLRLCKKRTPCIKSHIFDNLSSVCVCVRYGLMSLISYYLLCIYENFNRRVYVTFVKYFVFTRNYGLSSYYDRLPHPPYMSVRNELSPLRKTLYAIIR